MSELLPRLERSPLRASRYGIGLTIDAEEADRLELSLDLIEALCGDSGLARLERARLRGAGVRKRAPA